MTITSVVTLRTNAALIAYVAPLWMRPEDIVVDVTYGGGKWWTAYRPCYFKAHDLYTLDGVDFRQLPEADGCIDVVAFDPPYVAPGGRKTSTIDQMNDAYGMQTTAETPEEQALVIAAGLKEIARVLKPGGRVLAKCSDYISSGTFQQGHHWMVRDALAAGLVQVDEFIHVTGTGPQPKLNRDGTPRRQVHARSSHSFLCVFQKPRRAR